MFKLSGYNYIKENVVTPIGVIIFDYKWVGKIITLLLVVNAGVARTQPLHLTSGIGNGCSDSENYPWTNRNIINLFKRKKMRKLIAAINMTLDGYCDHTAVIADDELHEHYNALFRDAGLLLYGRITYQLMESYWPT